MKAKLLYGAAIFALAILVTLVVWQGSFNFGEFGPSSPGQTYLVWALSILIFILMVVLGFMLVRTALKLYVERSGGREGSRIKTRLLLGAVALSSAPVFFLVLFSIQILNINLNRWFSRPAQNIQLNLTEVSLAFQNETRARAEAQARWLAALPETAAYLAKGAPPALFDRHFCEQQGWTDAEIRRGSSHWPVCSARRPTPPVKEFTAHTMVPGFSGAEVVVTAAMPLDLGRKQQEIEREVFEHSKLASSHKEVRTTYILLLLAISLFILFLAAWSAMFLSRQISVPISALLEAAGQVRGGNLQYRVKTQAIDELATLVRAFNEMTQSLEASESELERRRQFTEAILESIPTGVISLTATGQVQKVNRALTMMFGEEAIGSAKRLDDLFPLEDAREIRYLMNRARRTGLAASQIELKTARQTLHLSVIVSALEGQPPSGFVVVLEDTSELLRAQKAAAWHEVARRIAHEMKNPLTPIALSAGRIARQLERLPAHQVPPDVLRVLRQCSATISTEVESVKTLVDEFSTFARFPAAQPAPADLNDVVASALEVFSGRLDGIELNAALAAGLPEVNVDREQFKRVIVNLVDNAAEAMQDSPLRRLFVATQSVAPDLVELTVADTGPGVTGEDKEKLFLPYFSTKGRGTGLGLAIVHHILAEHGARIRVEDNEPRGARFIVEIPAPVAAEAEIRAVETLA